jgi:Transposase IS116/IS110/IS902 family/Quinolinate synthetase A protein
VVAETDFAGSTAEMIRYVGTKRPARVALVTECSMSDNVAIQYPAFDAEFVRWVKENEEARRLTTIPGVGPIVASALVAAIGRAESFDRGRDLAAWLGLVPRQFTTGGKPKLLGISKRGNKYLRRQLIHGARAALPYVAERDTPLGRWAKELMSRAHHNVAVVAFANKLARIAWAVLRRGERFAAQECRWRPRVRVIGRKASNGQQVFARG